MTGMFSFPVTEPRPYSVRSPWPRERGQGRLDAAWSVEDPHGVTVNCEPLDHDRAVVLAERLNMEAARVRA